MVRKWLHITTINSNFRKKALFLSQCGQDPNVNVTTYLEEDYPLESRLFRRQWARRKHTTSWLFILNVISTWSKEYRFNSLMIKSSYAYKFFKYSYLTFNVTQTTHFISGSFRGTEEMVTSHWPKRLIKYVNAKIHLQKKHFITLYSDLNLTFASYNSPFLSWDDLQKNKVYMPIGLTDNSELFGEFNKKNTLKQIFSYNTICTKLILQQVLILRKLITLLILQNVIILR